MRLYLDGRLMTTVARSEDGRNSLARLKRNEARHLELIDGERKLSLETKGGLLFLDVDNGAGLFYGAVVEERQALGALLSFLKGKTPKPRPDLSNLPGGTRHVVVGDSYRDDCPLCRMMGQGG
ncbi:MAG: hypothetical protein FD126_725 [Elusimicrobia bacterium]|nr:MAG: hypothetical protein FD126_725 [Elusimicrobiota bacterium]